MGTNGALSSIAVRAMIVALIAFTAASIIVLVLGNVPTPPKLPGLPTGQWEELKAEQTERLSTYGWINEEAGVVHIPIERAIELQLDRGYPVSANATAQSGE